ncbi:cytochrome P460 family protein [Rhizobium leguminosarum]|uniref:cytochrome P460 family protein n=1 Tax=Rhizobium TaxID=379 RepID=UPI0010312152|nr:cytochrome P460 family protein [Rhizobium leguminosarum]TAV40658.1 hypothetical protein ELI31_35355 [Rhizobium leguminosarum]TAV41226.1 hypothetical protein ELI32_35350 [Rhizobium leguminosarum]TAV61091.1 hypothetical protein ELI30_35140 [Rhizobium leguminosarum]
MEKVVAASLLMILASYTGAGYQPSYERDGRLILPKGYETWVFVGSNFGLAYNPDVVAITALEVQRGEQRLFHNIYIEPSAFAQFIKTGEFPDPTVFVMESYTAGSKDPGGILNDGFFNADRSRVEAAVKDSHRPGRSEADKVWAYYSFATDRAGQPATAAPAFPDQACHACHEMHAGHDNVWVQFYPKLRAWLKP